MSYLQRLGVLILTCYLTLNNLPAIAQCDPYIPRPENLGLSEWPDNKRPASECEVLSAQRTYDSLRVALRNIYSLNRAEWVRVNEPDSSQEITFLHVFEQVDRNLQPTIKNYFKIKNYPSSQLFDPDFDWHFHYRRNEDLPQFKEVNIVRLQQRTRLMEEMSQLRAAGKQTSPLLEDIVREIALTDAEFWGENAFDLQVFVNSSDSPTGTLSITNAAKVEYFPFADSAIWLVRVEHKKDFDPKRILDGNMLPEDLIDSWYVLVGNWPEPYIVKSDDGSSLSLTPGLNARMNILDVHYLIIKIRGSEKVVSMLQDKINWDALNQLIAR